MAAAEGAAPRGAAPGWVIVFGQELRDLWLGGRGLVLSFAFSVLLSVIAYLVATNRALNFLEQREALNLTLQVAIAVGALLSLLAAADAVSGERERGTLESLLLAPVSQRQLTGGKLAAALTLWLVAFAITVLRLVSRPRHRDRCRRACERLSRRYAARGLPRFARDRSQHLRRLEPRQPLAQPLPPARPLRTDSAPVERAERLGRRPPAPHEPADGRRALRGQDPRRRPRLE